MIAPVTDLLFVYGTLRSGGENHGVLAPWTLDAGRAVAPRLRLFTDGVYPYAWPAQREAAAVVGEVVTLREPDLALAALDRFEGPGYRREVVEVVLASGARRPAWTYVAARDPLAWGLRPLEQT